MSWLMKWITEDEEMNYEQHECWATSWQEVMGHFMSWIAPDSEIVKGKVICYFGDKPYGDNNPCLSYNILPCDIDMDEY